MMTKPLAGEEILSRWVVVIRGGNNPLVVDDKSKVALEFGVEIPRATPPVPGIKAIFVLLREVEMVRVPALSSLISPSVMLEVVSEKLLENKLILSAAASWISAVVEVAPPDNCKDAVPARRSIE